ncbi:MAG: DUF3347 domain-containing protein [Leeuwenhoekiella sp.]
MKNIKTTVIIILLSVTSGVIMSCKESAKDNMTNDSSAEMNHMNPDNSSDMTDHKMGAMNMSDSKTGIKAIKSGPNSQKSAALVESYLTVKEALVSDNKEGAASGAKDLSDKLDAFDSSAFTSSEKDELKEIIDDAKEHAEHIAKSEIDNQREHFDLLSKDIIDLLAITGTDKKLYQDFCPMYNDGKGAQWLSATSEIKNPYFGSKMSNCGSVQQEIN